MAGYQQIPEETFLVDPCKKKKETSHIKGQKLALPRRKGSVKLEYIREQHKRNQCLTGRKHGLFKKAYELNKLTGKFVKAQVGQYYWSSASPAADVNDENNNKETDKKEETTQDDPMLSPQHITVYEVTSASVGTQCSEEVLSSSTTADSSEQCRVCGKKFADDSKHLQNLWLGCDEPQCNYWLHAECLLGKSKKNTPKFVKTLPFRCVLHR